MNDDMRAGLAEIEAKLELLRRTETEHGFGVTIEGPLEPADVPELPAGVTEVFRLFSHLAGDYFRFRQPEEIQDPDAWAKRRWIENCPLGDPLVIGWELHGIPADLLEDINGGGPIRLDLNDGSVYYVDPDDYVFMYKHVDIEEIDSEDFADDVVTFFNHYVLGERYPRLVEGVLGAGAVTATDRKGRHRDRWMRLLSAAGLLAA
ncbi:hypothetical protein [Actinomadura livida]|uniref:SMI1/KNR4 family protein n=1 Tax=Actinomadura livida TaxID=79909 RepID=A0A7W7IK58_9ACTN|nr:MULTISPECIES: hypothetical protein [Actinomadura]MBB4778584.1 hypothetical protein [Actinomadura catellatispora]GGU30029.1 hypothetical protein GCM10010208_63470 [Actinomadura livida]